MPMPLSKLEAARRALATDTVEGQRMEELKGELSTWRRDVVSMQKRWEDKQERGGIVGARRSAEI